MTAYNEKIARLTVLALFGRKHTTALLSIIDPQLRRYGPLSPCPQKGAATFFAYMARHRPVRTDGRLTLETTICTHDLVAIEWRYAHMHLPLGTGRPRLSAEWLEGTCLMRIAPGTARITHIWQMGDELLPVALPTVTPSVPIAASSASAGVFWGGGWASGQAPVPSAGDR